MNKKLKTLVGCLMVLVLSLSSCGRIINTTQNNNNIKITFEKLSGRNGIDFGKPVMYLNWSNSTFPSQLFLKGNELLVAIPDDNGVIHTSKPVEVKGKLISTYDYDYSMGGASCRDDDFPKRKAGFVFVSMKNQDPAPKKFYDHEGVLWVSSQNNHEYYLTSYHMQLNSDTLDIDMVEQCSVRTETPIIVLAINDHIYDEKITPFIVCQSTDLKKVAYYDITGKVLNSYNIDRLMIMRTRDTFRNQAYGFDGKSICRLTLVKNSKDKFKITQKYDIDENFNLEKTECWTAKNLISIYCQTRLVIIDYNYFVSKQQWMLAKFDNVLEVFKFAKCFRTTEGVYSYEYDRYINKPVETKLFDVEDGQTYSYFHYYGMYASDIFCKIFIVNDHNKQRIVLVKRNKEQKLDYLYSDYLDTSKYFYTSGSYIFNSDGVWATSDFQHLFR